MDRQISPLQQPGQQMKWTPELNKCVILCHFTAAKGAGPVRREQYPHLAAKVTEQRVADQNRTIMVRYLLSEV